MGPRNTRLPALLRPGPALRLRPHGGSCSKTKATNTRVIATHETRGSHDASPHIAHVNSNDLRRSPLRVFITVDTVTGRHSAHGAPYSHAENCLPRANKGCKLPCVNRLGPVLWPKRAVLGRFTRKLPWIKSLGLPGRAGNRAVARKSLTQTSYRAVSLYSNVTTKREFCRTNTVAIWISSANPRVTLGDCPRHILAVVFTLVAVVKAATGVDGSLERATRKLRPVRKAFRSWGKMSNPRRGARESKAEES